MTNLTLPDQSARLGLCSRCGADMRMDPAWYSQLRRLNAQVAGQDTTSLEARVAVLEALPAGHTDVASGTLSGASVVLATGIVQTFARLFLRIVGMQFDANNCSPALQVSTDSSSYDSTAGNYAHQFLSGASTGAVASASLLTPLTHATAGDMSDHTLSIDDYQGGYARSYGIARISGAHLVALAAYFGSLDPLTALQLVANGGNFNGGAWKLIGVR